MLRSLPGMCMTPVQRSCLLVRASPAAKRAVLRASRRDCFGSGTPRVLVGRIVTVSPQKCHRGAF